MAGHSLHSSAGSIGLQSDNESDDGQSLAFSMTTILLRMEQLLPFRPMTGTRKGCTPATTRLRKPTLMERWLEGLLSPLLPQRHKIRNMLSLGPAAGTAAKGAESEVLRESEHLVGTARHRTLRVHHLDLEHMRKAGPSIPWEERDLRTVLNTLLDEETTPPQAARQECTFSWLTRSLGLVDVALLPRLPVRERSTLGQVASTVSKPDDTVQHSSLDEKRFAETTGKVLQLQTKTMSAAQPHASIDLGHPDWEDRPAASGAEQSPPKSCQSLALTKSWPMDEPSTSSAKRITACPARESYELPSNNGPLFVAIRETRTPHGKSMVHLQDITKATRCGWRLTTGTWVIQTSDEHRGSKHDCSKGSKCLESDTFPHLKGTFRRHVRTLTHVTRKLHHAVPNQMTRCAPTQKEDSASSAAISQRPPSSSCNFRWQGRTTAAAFGAE